MAADGTQGGFSPATPGESGSAGPSGNTGQKGASHGALIDWLTVTAPLARLQDCGAAAEGGLKSCQLHLLLAMVFGGEAELKATSWSGKRFQFYADSATIVDRDGEAVGKIAYGGNADTIIIDLQGAGCRWVKDWRYVQSRLEILHARISRCDVAYDDYEGTLINVHSLREEAKNGRGFACGGRPPKSSFLDDHGSGAGCTLYVGQKGHKELCVYEKGKQLKDETSPWTRAECRFYGKHVGGVPLEILLRPLDYLRGAYPILERILIGATERLATVARTVEATATAMVKWMKTQCGPSLGLLMKALHGPDEFLAFARDALARDSRPGRFKRCGARDDLQILIRNQLLCLAST